MIGQNHTYCQSRFIFSSSLYACDISPDGKWVAAAAWDNQIYFLNIETEKGKTIPQIKEFPKVSYELQPDKKSFTQNVPSENYAEIMKDGRLGIKAKKALSIVTRGAYADCKSCCFSPDGKWIAGLSDDYTVSLWDASRGRLYKTFETHSDFVRCFNFSSDSNWLATGSNDKTIRLFDMQTGRTIKVLRGHLGSVESCSFSSDGKWLVSTGDEHTVHLWKLYDQNSNLEPYVEWTNRDLFFAAGAKIQDITGLSPSNKELLKQYDALVKDEEKKEEDK